ncbi:hypothetical protein [Aquibacillus rhizosphaerae]|uniref:IDEAL domain-containing protein n=1 Tax=Aquibacillus rhizosphaerae TaxID=3051431 RepID=A0ABT7LBK2_9BACI|nr:hypothetical protein [Aquibacillus sp. LR5S19]MDL4843254.1 hypothetical protein [Aquibacillus sp. LR5S19]
MVKHFITVQSFFHQIDCFCPDGDHSEVIKINKGDVIKIINERKYINGVGWYFLIEHNSQNSFFAALSDLDYYHSQGLLLSIIDIELTLNYLNFQVDHALDNDDELEFIDVSNKIIESDKLKKKLVASLKSNKPKTMSV